MVDKSLVYSSQKSAQREINNRVCKKKSSSLSLHVSVASNTTTQ